MASTSTSQGILPSPCTSATRPVGLRSLISSCCNCFNCCSVQSNSMASTSTTTTQVTNVFQEIAPSAFATNAFEQVVAPSASTSGRSKMPERKLPYHIFINHRGPDVKHTLAATLYNTLTGMGLRVFLDSQELELGDSLPIEIEEAMRSASLHIAIFSPKYAQSPWCLAELSFMLKTGTQIVPIFYNVKPEDVRYAKGVYGDTFIEHEKKGRYTLEKLQEWKKALNSVSYNVGIIHNEKDEGSLLKDIVNRALKVIKNVPFVVAKHPTGLDEAVIDFERTTLESVESHSSVQIVGIWGMGGSGKTTLAKQLYINKKINMDKSSFLFDVREAAFKGELLKKQKKLLEDLGLQNVSVENIEEGKGILANHLRSVRVLIVLDDVDNADQLDALVPNKDNLGWGSLIVVTTREFEVLRCWGISSIYKMKALDPLHAKKLFCWHAFLQPSPLQEFEDLVENFLIVCNGLPLSLKIFGAQLYGISSKDYWKIQLQKISTILHQDIKERLKISYDALDDQEKQIFLDIACLFIGRKKTSALVVWDGSQWWDGSPWNALHSWERLLSKCLVELDNDDRIRMHDHLRDMGREIANHQSPYRLWSSHQIINVDNELQGISVRGIMATTAESTSEVEQFPRCFQRGELIFNTSRGLRSLPTSSLGLKILKVSGNYYNQVIGDLSRELVWLRWFDIRQRNLSSLNSMKNLRVLELYENLGGEHHLEELWETDSNAPVQLRELVISQCLGFRRFPKSIGCLGHLKKIVVSSGSNLRSLPKEFCLLQSLDHLELTGEKLSSLPSSFGDLRNLRHLHLSKCLKLKRLPASFKDLTLLQHLNLKGCSKLTLESDILENMSKLEHLNLSGCRQLEELPRHITNQASLKELHLDRTKSLREVPVKIGQLGKLQMMKIGSELLISLPTSIGDLSSLTSLEISNCKKLEYLPDSLGRLDLLENLVIRTSGVKSLPKSVGKLNNLQTLDISWSPISELDLGAGLFTCSLRNLKHIHLCSTEVSKISISEDCCPGLEILTLGWNDHLTEIEVLPKTLKHIALEDCNVLRNIRGIDGLVNIEVLSISGCPVLDALPSFAQSAFLRGFELKGCYGVKKIEGLEHCRALETLRAHTRWEEAGIESLERMERLRKVELRAISRSGVEGCIQSMQKRAKEEIIVCTRAVPGAASIVNSFDFPNLSVVDSFANQKIKSDPFLKWPSDAGCILLCFVLNCKSPKTLLDLNYTISNYTEGRYVGDYRMELEGGKWVWTALFTQHSTFHKNISSYTQSWVHICGEDEEVDGEVEKGVLLMGEEEKVVEAFPRLCVFLSN